MATYLAHDALRLPAASLLANSGLCVNIEIKIWLLLGVNVDTAINKAGLGSHVPVISYFTINFNTFAVEIVTASSSIFKHYSLCSTIMTSA